MQASSDSSPDVSSQLQAAVKKAAELAPHPLMRKLDTAAHIIRFNWASLSAADRRIVVMHLVFFLLAGLVYWLNPPVWLRVVLCLLCLVCFIIKPGFIVSVEIPIPSN